MSYDTFFSKLKLYNITSQGYFLTDFGRKSVEDIIYAYSDEYGEFLDKNLLPVLLSEARVFCVKEKIHRKELERLEKLRVKAETSYKANFSLDFNESSIQSHKLKLMQLIPFSDVRDAKFHFFDETSRSIMNIHEKIFMSINGLESEQELRNKCLMGYADFNPLRSEPHYLQTENGIEITILNLCKTPKWLSLSPNKTPIEDGLIFKMIMNLFPEAESREFALCWAYHAITSRNHTYLSLVGARGVGKGMFADLIGQLVGRNYFQKCGDSILEGNFNGQFENSRVLFFDEVAIDEPEKINKLKALANNHISLEGKGKDARTIRNYTSAIIASNPGSAGGMDIGPQERRFSIVTIGKIDLRKILSLKEIETLVEILERDSDQEPDQEIVNFGHWLLENYKTPKYSNTHTYKEEYFYEISMNGLSDWKQFLILYIENNYQEEEPVTTKQLKDKFADNQGLSKSKDKIIFPQARTISNFLHEYKYRDEFSLGSMIDVRKDNTICKALSIDPELRRYLMNKNNVIDL